MNLGTECKMGLSTAFSSFGSKAEMIGFAPNFFQTFSKFLGRFSLTFATYTKFGFLSFLVLKELCLRRKRFCNDLASLRNYTS